LLVAVGILSSGRTFPVAFSWSPSEDKDGYVFFWGSLKVHCFEPPDLPRVAPPNVILGDQNKGLTASIPEVFLDTKQQLCTWHAREAMIIKARKIPVSKDIIDSVYEERDGQKICVKKGLRRLCKEYIESSTQEQLDERREALCVLGGPKFRE